jgi:hypothetical protein
MIHPAAESAKTDMRNAAKHLAHTLVALGVAALTLLGIHRH